MTTEEFIRDIIPLQPAMRRMAERMLHDEALAADAVQETLARLWSHRWRLGWVADKQGYCLRAVRNECVDMLRRKYPTVDADTLADNMADTAEQEADDTERLYRRLDEAVATLTPMQQQLVRLRFVEGRSSKEIATLTGLTVTNVDTIMSRTYTLLREKMQ